MKLDEIIDTIFQIAIDIEYHNIKYSGAHLVGTKRQPRPSDLLTSIAGSLRRSMVDSAPLGKAEIMTTLETLKSIGENYKIRELKKPIANLETYLDSLG